MRGATCFSGIGAPETALPEVDWVWCAEIEKFPAAVLKHRYPHSVNLGDVTAADFIARAQALGPIDLLVGGPPCQAFSVAGLRNSLLDDRGNMTLRFVEVIRAIDPRYMLFENVPGILSTSDNAFGCFLGALVGSGAALVPARGQRWTNAGMVDGPERTAAWAVRDAQHHGVPQRRRRVFVLSGRAGDFGVAQVLFRRESLRGNPAKGKKAGQGVTALTSNGVGTCGADDNQAQGGHLIAHCLNAKGGAGRIDGESETFVTCPLTGNPYGDHESRESLLVTKTCPTLRAGGNRTGGDRPPGTDVDTADSLVVTYCLRGEGFDASEDGAGRGTPLVPVGVTIHGTDKTASVASFTNIAAALRARAPGGQENSTTTAVMTLAIRGRGDSHDLEYREDGIANAVLTPNGGRAGIGVGAVGISNQPTPKFGIDVMPTLNSHSKGGGSQEAVFSGMAVRRLTVTECERLMGFPDGHTALPGAADGPRYKACGNSMAVPVIRAIGLALLEIA